MRYAAVIAAAGLSSRMHEFKPMLCVNGTTIIKNVVNNMAEAGCEEIVVVAGYKAELLEKHLAGSGVTVVRNAAFAETKMFDSVVLGIESLKGPYDYVFLTPCDVPLVKPETVCAMKKSGAPVVRPYCGGEVGHPILLSFDVAKAITAYGGENGLRGAIESCGAEICDIAVDDRGVLLDADTPEDFKALRRHEMELKSGGYLWPDIRINVSKGDVVLTPENAQFVEMIGHTGSIQSACACVHISYSKGWKMLNDMEKELGYRLIERFPGGSYGGGSMLTAKGKALLAAYAEYRERVNELSGQLFDEIFSGELHG